MSGFKDDQIQAPDIEIGFVVGLQAEARILKSLNLPVAVGGGGFAGATHAAEKLIAAGCKRLVSFGLAGGLDPKLKAGALLVPNQVIVDGEHHSCDAALVAWLGYKSDTSPLLGGRDIIASRADKAKAFAETSASAIDLESGAVATVAHRHGATFAVLRAVCDPAERDLPPAALIALDQTGRIGGLKIARSILASPKQIIALLALARDAGAARETLRRRVRALKRVCHG